MRRALIAWVGFVLCIQGFAQQYVELRGELAYDNWHWWSFQDGLKRQARGLSDESIFYTNHTFHCVVGTNEWLIEHQYSTAKRTFHFTGTNIVAQSIHDSGPDFTDTMETADGNPGRGVRG